MKAGIPQMTPEPINRRFKKSAHSLKTFPYPGTQPHIYKAKHSINVKHFLSLLLILSVIARSEAQSRDTLRVRPADLDISGIQTGNYSYLIIRRVAPDSPATGLTMAKMSVVRQTYHNKPAIVVRQQWERDSVIHKAYTVFDARDFSTLFHDTWWRVLGYALIFDFEVHTFSSRNVNRSIPDSVRVSCEKEMAAAAGTYNLNWHDDLIIYTMLPYRAGRTFLINYYDPGFGVPAEVPYTVTGSDTITDRGGWTIDCWVLQHTDNNGTERFWIAKKKREVLKEEDHGRHGYRLKVKIDPL